MQRRPTCSATSDALKNNTKAEIVKLLLPSSDGEQQQRKTGTVAITCKRQKTRRENERMKEAARGLAEAARFSSNFVWLDGLTSVYGLLPLVQGRRRDRASLTHGRGRAAVVYTASGVEPRGSGPTWNRAPGANRCSGLEGTCLLTALPRRRSDRSAMWCDALSARCPGGSLFLSDLRRSVHPIHVVCRPR